MTTFFSDEEELTSMPLTSKEIVDSLDINDVYNFLISLGIDEKSIEKKKDYLCLPTYCHNNLLSKEPSHKLYWYHNNKCFHCYTECDGSMSIFEFYKRFMAVNGTQIAYFEAVDYIKQFIKKQNIHYAEIRHTTPLHIDRDQYEISEQICVNTPIQTQILDCFIKCYPQIWLDEGISSLAMDKFGIRYCIPQQKIIIPHFDIDGKLIGIRGRALNPEEIENGQKYMPVMLGGKTYSHKLSQNLYGVYENQKAIRKFKRAIIAEGEKSSLKGFDFDGENNIIIACCGHNINAYQVNLLVKKLGVNEIVIAFDKEYDTYNSPDGIKDLKRTKDICEKYKSKCSFSYIVDYDNLLKRKDSPVDRGVKIWQKLYSARVRVI